MSLGTKLYELRSGAGLSQDALAEKMGVSRQSVSKWETDASTPELDKLIKLAELYGVTLDELILDRPPKEPEIEEPPVAETNTVYIERPVMPGARIAGIVLLSLGGVALILAVSLLGIGGAILALPMLVSGTLCLTCKKRPALWAAWGALMVVEAYLGAATNSWAAAFPTQIYYRFFRQEIWELQSKAAIVVSGALFAINVAMALWTVMSFRKSRLRPTAKSVALTAALWLSRVVLLPAAGNAIFRSFVYSVAAGDRSREPLYTAAVAAIDLAEPAFTVAALTLTVLMLKNRSAGVEKR